MTGDKKAYKVTANDFNFVFDETEAAELDLVWRSPGEMHIVHKHESVSVRFLEADLLRKRFKVLVAGEIFYIEIKDSLDQMVERMGFGAGVNKKHTEIKAPMPGLVLEIAVAEGQAVNEGEKILVLEAMKMENSIMVPAAATIKKILVSKGQPVDRGQVLIELD